MGHFIIITILAITLPLITPAILPNGNPMGALFQNLRNPANADKVKQILQLTGAVNKVPTNPVFNLLQEVAVPRPTPVQVSQVPRQIVPIQQVQQIQEFVPFPVNQVQPCSPNLQAVQRFYPYASPAPMVNPFLPAASPVSAIAPPTSSLLPPIDPTQVRSQFLRKIPIPPPSL